MALNIDKLKSRLESFQEQSKKVKTSELIWKPPIGKSQLRIVPYKFNSENPFIELYFHFKLDGKKFYLSPVSYGEDDPIAQFSEKLKRTGDKDNWLLSKKLQPTFRVYAPVLVRGEESKGIRFWGFGKTVYSELINIISDPDYGDITDPLNGRDITINHTAPDNSNPFGKISVMAKPNKSKLMDSDNDIKLFLENQKNIYDVYTKYTYEELAEVLEKYLNPEDNSKEKEEVESTTSQQSKKVENKNVDSALSKFDDLF